MIISKWDELSNKEDIFNLHVMNDLITEAETTCICKGKARNPVHIIWA
jgi:hypothetical protein